MASSLIARIATFVIAGLAGVMYGVVGTVAHASIVWWIPIGLVLAIVGTAALLLAIRLLADRWAALAAGIGMTAAVVLFSGEGPGGSVISPEGVPAVIWTVSVPLIAMLVIAWPDLSGVRTRLAS